MPRRWTAEEDQQLKYAVEQRGPRNWKSISELVDGRSHTQCLQRWSKVLKPGLIKGHWSNKEDALLTSLFQAGWDNWTHIAENIPGRTSKQCRERWFHHLDPAINHSLFSEEEDQIILETCDRIGSKWCKIAALLHARTEDAVKIRWKTLSRHRAAGKTTRCPQNVRRKTKVSHDLPDVPPPPPSSSTKRSTPLLTNVAAPVAVLSTSPPPMLPFPNSACSSLTSAAPSLKSRQIANLDWLDTCLMSLENSSSGRDPKSTIASNPSVAASSSGIISDSHDDQDGVASEVLSLIQRFLDTRLTSYVEVKQQMQKTLGRPLTDVERGAVTSELWKRSTSHPPTAIVSSAKSSITTPTSTPTPAVATAADSGMTMNEGLNSLDLLDILRLSPMVLHRQILDLTRDMGEIEGEDDDDMAFDDVLLNELMPESPPTEHKQAMAVVVKKEVKVETDSCLPCSTAIPTLTSSSIKVEETAGGHMPAPQARRQQPQRQKSLHKADSFQFDNVRASLDSITAHMRP